jgi:3-methyladenine DNA glycosylase/8-oxoguanine DNA glycosylase
VSTAHEVTPQPERPTEEWVTGDEPMTGPQQSYLQTLAREAGEEPRSDLTKAQASEQIERLQQVTGRGA